jgi:hypothetical protein
MKKIFVFVTTTLFLIQSLRAQTDQQTPPPNPPAAQKAQENPQPEKKPSTGLHFGLKINPSLAWFSTDTKGLTSTGTEFRFGYGLITEFKFAPNYAFATGIDINYRGGNLRYSESTTVNDTTTSNVFDNTFNLEYVEIPITLKFKTNEIGSFTYFLQVGVEPGWLIRARYDQDKTTQITSGSFSSTTGEKLDNEDATDQINNVNVSMIIGGGIEYTLSGSTTILAGITFNNGFMDVFDGDNIKANSDFLGLTLGVLF